MMLAIAASSWPVPLLIFPFHRWQQSDNFISAQKNFIIIDKTSITTQSTVKSAGDYWIKFLLMVHKERTLSPIIPLPIIIIAIILIITHSNCSRAHIILLSLAFTATTALLLTAKRINWMKGKGGGDAKCLLCANWASDYFALVIKSIHWPATQWLTWWPPSMIVAAFIQFAHYSLSVSVCCGNCVIINGLAAIYSLHCSHEIAFSLSRFSVITGLVTVSSVHSRFLRICLILLILLVLSSSTLNHC